ncbi:unnamed protein product [Blepharisma stoltei]|uniref:General transcription factor IIH subunit 3 n=1 Tax=Blepharisma stoltei TaxID=1481888 RepID=A0AAU9JCP6_9CILI|nr:unnamed protein product [Blepharisma stoltei]
MVQNLIIVLDAIKSHWDAPTTSMISSSLQSITLPVLLTALQGFKNALKLQNSENTLKIFICAGQTAYNSISEDEVYVSGGVWKGAAQALCYINSRKINARILIIQKHSIQNEQNAALSVMVAAQSLKVIIDGIAFSDCSVLSQTATFTGGIYIRHHSTGILQILLQVFLPTRRPTSSTFLHLRPYCTCCSREVEKAYVCSCCLALYCSFSNTCQVCNSRLLVPRDILINQTKSK